MAGGGDASGRVLSDNENLERGCHGRGSQPPKREPCAIDLVDIGNRLELDDSAVPIPIISVLLGTPLEDKG